MGKRKKGKTKRNAAAKGTHEPEELTKAPHTFVVHRGHVGNNVTTLSKDMRQVMEPYTATNLKLRKKNVLKDMVAIAGPLGVTNFMLFSKTTNGTNMRIVRLPRGPTLSFQITKYSLRQDVISSLKRPQTFEGQFRYPPLLVLNNFKDTDEGRTKETKADFEVNPRKLCATMLQNMFPSINIHKVKLNHVKRCVSFSYNRDNDTVEFRHYNIAVKPMGMSRRLRKLITRKNLPDLGKYGDISEYLTQNPGEGSASESGASEAELDGPHNEVELPQNVSGKGNILHQQSAIRLTELGPRMTLKLVKCEEGMCGGEVLYHSIIEEDKQEIQEMLKRRQEKEKLKVKRKTQQEQNVAKKKELKEEMKKKSLAGMKRKIGPEEEQGLEPISTHDGNEDDDAEWYRKEVGEEPGDQFFSSKETSEKPKPKKKKFSEGDRNSKKKTNDSTKPKKHFKQSKEFAKKATLKKKKNFSR